MSFLGPSTNHNEIVFDYSKSDNHTIFNLLNCLKKDENKISCNLNLILKITNVLNERFEDKKYFSASQLKTLYKVLKKCKRFEGFELPNNFTINFQGNITNNLLLLACQSKFFKKMARRCDLSSDDSNENSELNLRALQFLNHYLSTGQTKMYEGMHRKYIEEDTDFIMAILTKAHEWKLKRLFKKIDDFFLFNDKNVEQIYSYGIKIKNAALIEASQYYINSLLNDALAIPLNADEFQHYYNIAKAVSDKNLEKKCLRTAEKMLKQVLCDFTTSENPKIHIVELKDFIERKKLAEGNDRRLHEEISTKVKVKEKEREEEEFPINNEEKIDRPYQEEHQDLIGMVLFFYNNVDCLRESFLKKLNLPELLLLLMLLPEKIDSLTLDHLTATQLHLLLPWLPSGLRNLEIDSCSLTKSMLEQIVRNCPNIESLTLQKLTLERKQKIGSFLEPLCQLTNMKTFSTDKIHFHILKKLISSWPELECLDADALQANSVNNIILRKICENNKKLKNLFFKNYGTINEKSVEALRQTFGQQLESLRLDSLEILPSLYREFSNLKNMEFKNATLADLKGFIDNSPENPCMEELTIYEADFNGDYDILYSLLKKFPNLKCLYMNTSKFIPKLLHFLHKHCSHLKVLGVIGSDLSTIWRKNKLYSSVISSNCQIIPSYDKNQLKKLDSFFYVPFQECPNLKELHLHQKNIIFTRSLINFENLEKIIIDEEDTELILKLDQLRNLQVFICQHTNKNLLRDLALKNPSLKIISNDSLYLSEKRLKTMEELSLACAKHIGNQ